MNDIAADRPDLKQNQVLLKRLVFIIFWSVLFTLVYAQAPVFTSNQNQYFLHGLADAGFGFLNQDWLANTLDPTPVFSGLIHVAYSIIPWSPIFYILFSLMAGVFIFSLYGSFSKNLMFHELQSSPWVFLTALLLINSAGMRFLVVRILGPGWAYFFDGGVAGQRLLGSVLQPSTFGVFLLLSIFLYLSNKPIWAVVSLIFAPTIHPTYLLSAAVITLVYLGLSFFNKKQMKDPLIIGGTALIGVIPILIHTYLTFGGTGPILAARARELLVDFRIPHHALPAEWFDASVIVKILIILIALFLTRETKVFHIILWPFIVGFLGTITQVITGSDTIALLFPWRISTWLVPLSVTAVLYHAVRTFRPLLEKRVPPKVVIAVCIVVSIALAGTGFTKSIWEYQEKNSSDDRAMMAYISNNKTSGEVYMIPLDMQDFRLTTGAPAYVEFKSIPYKDVDVLEWYRRVSLAGNLYRAPRKRDGCSIAAGLQLEGVTHIVLPYDHTIKNCSNLERQYLDEHYEVYSVRKE